MIKYKVNLKFKYDSKSLNEIVNEMLKIELQKNFNDIYSNPELDFLSAYSDYYQEKITSS